MIIDSIINLLLAVPRAILAAVPSVGSMSIPFPVSFSTWLTKMIQYSKYLFPMELLLFILITMTTLRIVRSFMAVFRFVKNLIPGMGG